MTQQKCRPKLIHSNGSSGLPAQPSAGDAAASLELLFGGARGAYDPYVAAREAPVLWQRYLHAHFNSHQDVARAFWVSDACARKWWAGTSGAKHDKVMVACKLHPDTAPKMLGVVG